MTDFKRGDHVLVTIDGHDTDWIVIVSDPYLLNLAPMNQPFKADLFIETEFVRPATKAAAL